VKALFIVALVLLGIPALAARATASATIVVPAYVSPVQANLWVSVTTVSDEEYAHVTVAFN
jgi:hypothetical protein